MAYRVATWNLWGRLGDDPDARAPEIEALLREVDADVVGLQEVWNDDGHDVTAELGRALGYDGRWVLGAPQSPSGIAVLSRWPLRRTQVWDLPADAAGSEGSVLRRLLHAEVELPDGVLPFFTTHLTWYLDASPNRCDQVRAVLAAMASVDAGPGALPPVLVGDLNAGPDTPELALLRESLVDAWTVSADPAGGLTWSHRNPYVVATGEPENRLDHVYAAPARPDGAGRLLAARMFAEHPGPGGVWASDHAGVVVDLASPADPALR